MRATAGGPAPALPHRLHAPDGPDRAVRATPTLTAHPGTHRPSGEVFRVASRLCARLTLLPCVIRTWGCRDTRGETVGQVHRAAQRASEMPSLKAQDRGACEEGEVWKGPMR